MAETYRDFNLPDLWNIVRDEDPESGFTHVSTLNRLRTALEQQRDNLRVHRDQLTDGWPPSRSEAAWAFAGRINDMIDVMTQTADAANLMAIGVDEAYAAVREVRRQLESMMAQYSRATGQGLLAGGAKHAELDQRGRDVVIAADARIVGAAEKINAAVPQYRRFDEVGARILRDQDADGGGSTQSTGRQRGIGNGPLQSPVFDPPSPGDGLTLAEQPERPGGTSGDGTRVGVPAGPVGVIGGAPGSGKPAPATPGGVAIRPGVLAPGGVISAPRPGGAAVGQPAVPMPGGAVPRAGASQAARTRPATSSAAPAEPLGSSSTVGGYRDRSYEEYTKRRRSRPSVDGDELWGVDEGVPPVLEAPPERRHDPGPGVVGIDR
ncbi:hypothetical protein ABT369_43360 [Dactylosporangium sp. NPDC000244]|uniref:hypothetical protein n=1 Tax=Dactylosporangium sp. NPDC000244 TaxID=3154365 RepID=UPI00332383E9